jgi:S1-C subfamily serine protease
MVNTPKTKLHGSIILLILLTGCTFSFVASRKHYVFSRIRDAVVHVGQYTQGSDEEIGQLLGSGFFVDHKGTVVTAKHLLKNADEKRLYIKYIPIENRNTFHILRAKVVYQHEIKDLAFLKAINCPSQMRPLSLIQKLDTLASLGGEAVLIGGFPRLGDKTVDYPIVRRAIISSTEFTDAREETPLILLDLAGAPGFSGSPVALEGSGQVVGVVTGSVSRRNTGQGYHPQGATPITQSDYDQAIRSDSLN